jgi:hypothetical protein
MMERSLDTALANHTDRLMLVLLAAQGPVRGREPEVQPLGREPEALPLGREPEAQPLESAPEVLLL